MASKKLMGLLQSVIGTGGSPMFNIKMPSVLKFGYTTENITSLGGLVRNVVQSAQNILYSTRIVGCLFSSGNLQDGFSSLHLILKRITDSASAVVAKFAIDLASAVSVQVKMALGQIVGTALSTVNNLFSFIKAIGDLITAITDTWDYFTDINIKNNKWFLDKEDCESMFTNIGRCLLNQLLGDRLKTLENQLLGEITKGGQSFNDKLSENLSDVTAINNYVENQTFMLNKATEQINGIRK